MCSGRTVCGMQQARTNIGWRMECNNGHHATVHGATNLQLNSINQIEWTLHIFLQQVGARLMQRFVVRQNLFVALLPILAARTRKMSCTSTSMGRRWDRKYSTTAASTPSWAWRRPLMHSCINRSGLLRQLFHYYYSCKSCKSEVKAWSNPPKSNDGGQYHRWQDRAEWWT